MPTPRPWQQPVIDALDCIFCHCSFERHPALELAPNDVLYPERIAHCTTSGNCTYLHLRRQGGASGVVA